MYTVYRTFQFQEGVAVEQEILKGVANVYEVPCKTQEELIEKAQEADTIICAYEPFTKRVFDNLPKLKHLAFKTIGFNFADIDYAREKGIAVSHISQYCIKEVADYVVAQILMLNRRILQFDRSVHVDRKWQYNLFPEMRRFQEETVGLIGFGNIPKLITARLKPFGPKVIAYDPYVDKKTAEDLGVTMMEFDEVLENADYVSIHLPLSPQTQKIINKEKFDKMKEGAILINSARGMVVDEEALVEALDSKKIKFAALDVLYDEYPDIQNHPLAGRNDVVLTPHIAFYSQESIREGRVEAALNVLNFFKGEYDKCQIVNGVKFSK